MPHPGLHAFLALWATMAAQRPPSAAEQQAFSEGLQLFEAGDARGAERAWRAGYAAGHDPAFLIRIAEAQEKAGAPREAVRTYEEYLRESPDAADRADVEARVRRLNPGGNDKPRSGENEADVPVGSLSVPAPPGTWLPLPGTPLAPGTGPAAASGSAAATIPAPSRLAQARDDGREELNPLMVGEAPRSRLNTAAWIGVGVTTLLLGVGAFFGASSADKSGDANRLLTFRDPDTGRPQDYGVHSSQFEEDVRTGRRDAHLATGFALGAGLTAVVSAVLFVLDGPTSPNKDAHLQARTASGGGHRTSRPPVPAPPAGRVGVGLSWSF
jgi:hypothetical protein